MTAQANLYLDRFEGGYAVLISGDEHFNVPRKLLPPHAAEGDYLTVDFSVATGEKTSISDEIAGLQDSLRKRESEE